ncbi:MAG TPA: 4Fe-4S dicluster domain-containing protein [Candidatus Marinimicrobia bacterium]|jgi:NADH-quinone oxidoreductase subunit I|nr:4Fe-4S dicluster domain-containing protein [Candidatus Neomarinimicrobiota bacterium]
MYKYLSNIFEAISTLFTGMRITWRHMMNIRKENVTLQYPEERWPRPERNIGFNVENYNVIRSRLHVDIDDCIGCLKCERVCPVQCIKINTVKVETKGEDLPDISHTGITSNGTKKALIVSRFDIDMTECCYCNLCVYPCPEECIYMTGGPNSHKHPIDYEFSQYDRNDLIYKFAKDVEDEKMSNYLPQQKQVDE